MIFRNASISAVISIVCLTALFYIDPGDHKSPGPTAGNAALSGLAGVAATFLYLTVYVTADLLRLWGGLRRWTLCAAVACCCAALTVYFYFQPVEESGIHGFSDVVYVFALIFMPSLPFGIPYTALYRGSNGVPNR